MNVTVGQVAIVDPDISDAMFEISSGIDTAYADTVGGAYLAYWQLRKDRATMGTEVRIMNLQTGKIVWHD